MKKKIYNNISWLFVDRIIRITGEIFIGIWVARYLGPKDFGVFNYALAYSALFMIFVRLGLDQIIIKEIVRKVRLTHYLLGTAFSLKLSGSVIAVISIYISFYFVESESLTKLLIFIISVGFIFKSFDVIDFYYQSKVLSKYVVIARNGAFLFTSLLKVFFIVYEFNVIYFAIANTLDLVLTGFFLVIVYKKTNGDILKWKFRKKIAFRLLQYSWPLALSIFLISIYMKIDQVMIGNMLNNEQVGLYSVSVRLSEFWFFIPGVLVSSLTPYYLNLREKNIEYYNMRLTQLYSFMFWLGVVVGAIIIVYGEIIIKILFGEAYAGAYHALIFNIWNGIFISQAMVRSIWLINENLQKYRLYNNFFGVILNIILNLILIPKMGITGAAIATLFTQALSTWFFPFVWRPLRNSTWSMIKSVNPGHLLNYKL